MYGTPRLKKNKLLETKELLQAMKIPHQKPEHPDHWITEAIDLLLEQDRDQSITEKYFDNNMKKKPLQDQQNHKYNLAQKKSPHILVQKTSFKDSNTGKKQKHHHHQTDI
jgi:hypothetical protein